MFAIDDPYDPVTEAKENQNINLMKLVDILPAFIRRYLLIHLAVVFFVPSPLISSIVFAYAIHEGIPPFEAIDVFGGRIIVVGLLSAFLFVALISIMLVPALIRISLDGAKSRSENGKLDFAAWMNFNGIAACSYVAMIFWAVRDDLPGGPATTYILCGIMASGVAACVLYIIASSILGNNIWRFGLWPTIYCNSMSLFIVIAVYAAITISAASDQKSIPNEIYELIGSLIGKPWSALFAGIFMSAAPLFMLFVSSARANDARGVIITSLFITILFVVIWPGGWSFVKGAFGMMRKGGDISFEMWMPIETACQYDGLIIKTDLCEKDVESKSRSKSIKTDKSRLGLLTENSAYIRIRRNAENKDADYHYDILVIPRSEFGPYQFGEFAKKDGK